MASDYESYKDRAAKRGKEMTTGKAFRLKEGDNTFRILMTPKGRTSPDAFFEFAVHENVGPEKAYLRCGIDPITGKGSCIICQKVIPRLRKRGKESRAAELEPRTKLVVQVAAVEDDKIVGRPKLWYPSKKVGVTVVSQIITSKKRDYLSHKKGYNLTLSRTGTGMQDTRYGMIEADEEPSKVPDKIVEMLKPFDELAEIPKYDEKKMKVALGFSAADDDDDEDDEPKKKKGKAKDDDEDDEEDEDEEDGDDEDGDSDDDDDEDNEDSDDEDEDDEEDDDSDEDEEDEPVKKKKVLKFPKKKKK